MADDDRPDGPSGSHPRYPAIGPSNDNKAQKRERINHIVGMMERFEWVRGESAPDLAERWGLAVATVESYSAEASRRITGDPDEARRDITFGARKLFKAAVDEGNAQAAKMMGELWATVSGAKAPEKHQVGALDGATPSKARELMGELFGAVTPASKPDADPER